MRAFVFAESGRLEERDLPAPVLSDRREADRGAAILAPRFLSPCSSDVHTVFAGNGPRRENLVLGHEGLAEVIETGDGVRDFKPGDLVAVPAVMPEVPDGTGHEHMPFSGTRLGRNIDGMWAERFYVPDADRNLAHIPAGMQPEQALMCVDMAATGYTAAEEAEIRPGQTVVVLGLGAVGLMAVSAARYMGASRVIAIGSERRAECTALAAEFGADLVLDRRCGATLYESARFLRECAAAPFGNEIIWREKRHPAANSTKSPAVDRVLDLTENIGADRVLICGGDKEALLQACDLVRYGSGIVSNVSYYEGSGTVGLPIFSLGRGMAGKTFRFALCRGGRKRVEELMRLVSEGKLADAGQLVTHRLSGFDRIPEALLMMRDKPDGLIKLMLSL